MDNQYHELANIFIRLIIDVLIREGDKAFHEILDDFIVFTPGNFELEERLLQQAGFTLKTAVLQCQ